MVYNCKDYNQINNNEYLLKICAIGSGNTGKTLFIRKFAETKFDSNYLPTLGVDITTKKICFNNTQIKLILVDTAGQEFFGKLRPSYYRGASAGLIFCNINDRKSIEAIPIWLKEFTKYLPPQTEVPIGIVVIKEWKYSHRKYKIRKPQYIPTTQNRIINLLNTIFRRKSNQFLNTVKSPKKKLRKKMVPTTLSHLTNIQLAKYFAESYRFNLFEIKVNDCRAIEDCFVSIARQVINR
ncbi:MAG: Rab family GTPase [Candidatus Hodarchaeales archaeon]|jgi:small GTP-binding protein